MKKAMTIRSLVAQRRCIPAIRLLSRREGRSLPLILAFAIIASTTPTGYALGADQPADVTSKTPANAAPAATAAAASAEPGPAPGAATQKELEELVSPIALYPDLLVARVLAASTYPDQVVEAHKWLQENSNLPREQLAAQVNAQPWDPSIKSLAQFSPVLQTMSGSLAWTSALGEAYYNQPDDVMKAIQSLRSRAMEAGTLKSTAQQKVEVQPAPPPVSSEGVAQPAAQQQTVIIQPAQQDVVYAPQYDPATAYGAPVQAPAGYTGAEMLTTGLLSFGAGMALGALINEDDDDWDCDWSDGGGGSVHYNNNVYVSNSPVPPARGNGNYPARPPAANRPGGIGGAGGVGGPGGIGGAGEVGRPGGVGGPGGVGRPGGIGGPGGVGGRPRPNPVRGTSSPNRLAGPSTRPYNPSKARPYAGVNPNIAKPTFPKASTLPNNPGLGNSNGNLAQNQPLRKGLTGLQRRTAPTVRREDLAAELTRQADAKAHSVAINPADLLKTRATGEGRA
jgi:Protein of unknown function (DUF3300)